MTVRTRRENNLVELVDTYHIALRDALMFQKISRRLRQLDEAACNYGLTPQQEKREARLEVEANLLAGKYQQQAYHQSDPWGWPLYLLPKTVTQPHADYTGYPGICPH